jgi:hypothetical protein
VPHLAAVLSMAYRLVGDDARATGADGGEGRERRDLERDQDDQATPLGEVLRHDPPAAEADEGRARVADGNRDDPGRDARASVEEAGRTSSEAASSSLGTTRRSAPRRSGSSRPTIA